MQLFTEYIQPITNWLYSNPEWALFFTFLISFAESLAVIGSIVPGSITMTTIGILAGSGVMRIDLTFIAATLGAIVGDGASYLLGYFFSDRLIQIWPFNRYPQWLEYGKSYFARHGGKSVLIGRFIGPLRSIIPVIAGMMHMSHWRFYLANFISAVFWSLLYVLPGVLIGAASTELPPESAAQLLITVLIIVVGVWLTSLFVKWALQRLNFFLNASLDRLWQRGFENSYFKKGCQLITPKNEKNHYPTAALVIILLLIAVLCSTLTVLVSDKSWLYPLNYAINLAVHSLRNETIDPFFICLTQIASVIPLSTVIGFMILLSIYFRQPRLLIYTISLIATTSVCLWISHFLIDSPRPSGILEIQLNNSYPSDGLTYLTALFSSFLLYLNKNTNLTLKSSINISFMVILILVGFGQILLGDYWLTDIIAAYLLGLFIALMHWLFYRRYFTPCTNTTILVTCYGGLLIIATFTACHLNYERSYQAHQPFITQYTLSNQDWWTQKKLLLPIYRRNRFGHPIGLFNLQYAGSLDRFSSALIHSGWTIQKEMFYNSLIKRLSGSPTYRDLPLMAQLYLNRKPSLVMSYALSKKGPVLILRLWRSNFYLQNSQEHIWIGSVHTRIPIKKWNTMTKKAMNPLNYVQKAMIGTEFLHHDIPLLISTNKKLLHNVSPVLLLIQEKAE